MLPNFLLFNDTCLGYKVFCLGLAEGLKRSRLVSGEAVKHFPYLKVGPAPETRASATLPASGGTSLALLAGLR
jgi:hypothetical protein